MWNYFIWNVKVVNGNLQEMQDSKIPNFIGISLDFELLNKLIFLLANSVTWLDHHL